MPQAPPWNCSRVADLLAELDAILKKYGLDQQGVRKEVTDHCDGCSACEQAIKKLEERFDEE